MKKYIIVALCVAISASTFAQNKNNKTETFKVFGTCEQCQNRIESTLKKMGVYKAIWAIATNMLTVTYDSIKYNTNKIKQKLADVGHDTKEFKTTESTYKSLPKCCYYKRELKAENPAPNADTIKSTTLKPATTNLITGIVFEETKKGKILPLVNATVRCLNSNFTGRTDSLGVFQLACSIPVTIAVSYVGYTSDTLTISSLSDIKIILKNASNNTLKEVVVNSKIPATYIASISTLNTLNMGMKELTKAACCNLSESFETSPSVDVSYADAVTGIKQIQLLGLSGNYTQLLTENIPEIRGLSGSYGLTFIPGPWIEGIQVTKGTGSVVNGYESIAGQINIEEKKPDKTDKLFVNMYANTMGRLETTINLSQKIGSNWSTALLAHVNGVGNKIDDNKDGFLDIPVGSQINVINRWKYIDNKGIIFQFAIKALNDQRQAGEVNFNPLTDKLTTNKYGVGIHVQQYEANAKLGYVFPQQKYKSIGLMVSAISYNNDSYYGLTKYDGKQSSIYGNLIYQSIIGNTNHKFRTGVSFVNDVFNETINTNNYKRTETVPGAFFEYTFSALENFTAIAGIRGDYHNQYGFIATPRLHMKYDISTNTNLRFSVGSGFRTANIFAENQGVFISARQYNIVNPSNNYGYGLEPEKAWNVGFNFVHSFKHEQRAGSFSVDVYHTNFINQTVTDVDANTQKILFYNLRGRSFSNSAQAEFNYELFKKFDVRLAYRWLDVQTNYSGNMLQKPLVAKHRAFINLAYETSNHLKFDFTTQWFSEKRLPNTSSNPADKQMEAYSPVFIQMSAQITKQFGKVWDIYIGAENLTNFTQNNLIISAAQPFSPYFDGSLIWGPVNGRIIYAGLRLKMK